MTLLVFPDFKQLSLVSLVGFPLLGLLSGITIALLSPPRGPADYWWQLYILGGGLGGAGLLLGVLACLWLRGRVSVVIALSAIAIPVCLLGCFASAKSVSGWTLLWALALGITVVVFIAQSVNWISGRDGMVRRD